jgi:hypothetical protein
MRRYALRTASGIGSRIFCLAAKAMWGPVPPEMTTVQRAAFQSGYSVSAIRTMVREGRIASRRIGGRIFVEPLD